MTEQSSPNTFIQAMLRQLSNADGASDIPALPKDVVAWLAQLVLLYGVPMEYLVAAPDLLPKESLRFFYLDSNWQRRLIDGALSVGLASSLDAATMLASYEDVVLQSLDATPQVRPRLLGKPVANAQSSAPDMITGFLLRSAAVSGWPGIEVAAYADPQAAPLKLLRLERVNSDILLGLVDGLPSEVNFLQPPEGLHFGVNTTGGNPDVFLRGLGHGNYPAGLQITPVSSQTTAAVTMRANGGAGVIDVAATVATFTNQLAALGAWSAGDPFTSAEFAIQMTRGAGLQIFQWA
ncbi:MAG: hypothetical protein ACM31D_08285 [Bacteroidota bacterium]